MSNDRNEFIQDAVNYGASLFQDEDGNCTNPSEAAAIAQAMLDEYDKNNK